MNCVVCVGVWDWCLRLWLFNSVGVKHSLFGCWWVVIMISGLLWIGVLGVSFSGWLWYVCV